MTESNTRSCNVFPTIRLFVVLVLAVQAAWAAAASPPRGRLANPGFEHERIRTAFFFSGQARDGTQPYGVAVSSNLGLYTEHPSDSRHLNWSVSPANRDFALNRMLDAGVNVITMSSWGEDFLPYEESWKWAPMQTAPASHDELFAAAVGKPLLIVPLIESRANWSMRNEFPRWTDNRVAPGTVSQVINLVNRYLKNGSHPEWAGKWARVHDRNGQARYAVALIHAASSRLAADQHAAFADGFDLVAGEVYAATGVRVGFLLDVLPPGTNAPGVLRPSPELTGPHLEAKASVLGIQCFIPEIWYSASDETDRIAWKRDFAQRWANTGIPFLMDISPGYDAHIVFPGSVIYGHNPVWTYSLAGMVLDYGQDGTVYNSWNGYTERMSFVPTTESGDQYFRWAKAMSAVFPGVPRIVPEPTWTKSHQNTVSWNEALSASVYIAQISDNPDFSGALGSLHVSSPTLEATFPDLVDGQTYWYRVNAINDIGISAWSLSTSSTQDATAPAVDSIVRVDGNPTSASAVRFAVTFTESVSGLTENDFLLTMTGALRDTSINRISGSDAAYTVGVDTGSGSGTLRLDVVDDDSIHDQAGNPLGDTGPGNGNFETGEVYEIEREEPVTRASHWPLY